MGINIQLEIDLKCFLYTFKLTVKYIITVRIPKLLLKKILFFFAVYKNEWIEHKF